MVTPHQDEDTLDLLLRPRKIGPFDLLHTRERLTLRRENAGELGVHGCLLLAFTMLFVSIIGVFGIVQTANSDNNSSDSEGLSRLFAPTRNHFGFLWVTALLVLFAAVPLYVWFAYRSALTYTFDRETGRFFRNKRPVTTLSHIEYVCIHETKDPDNRYLYLLELSYNDGEELLLYNTYDERDALNLANELTSFLERDLHFKS